MSIHRRQVPLRKKDRRALTGIAIKFALKSRTLPSAHEIDAAVLRKYGDLKPAKVWQYRAIVQGMIETTRNTLLKHTHPVLQPVTQIEKELSDRAISILVHKGD